MKQTVEEAAREYSRIWGKDNPYEEPCLTTLEYAFRDGVAWQSKQSPWISVEEKIGCDTSDDCIVMDKYGEVFRAYFSSKNKWLKSDNAYTEEVDNVVRWMPIPSFDEILEANKDVLQRLKYKFYGRTNSH